MAFAIINEKRDEGVGGRSRFHFDFKFSRHPFCITMYQWVAEMGAEPGRREKHLYNISY